MSTRRSRIQIKPNLGRKSDGPAGSGQRKPTPAAPAAATSGAGDSAAVGTTTIAAAAAPHEPSAADQPDVASVPEQPATVPVVEEPTPTAAAPPEETPCASDAVAETPAETPHVAEPTRAEPAVTKSPIKRPAPVIPACASPEKVARPSETSEPLTPQEPAATPSTPSEPQTRKGEKQVRRRSRRPPPRKPPTDRSAMTMQDLIYYNPPGKPMPEKPSKTSKDKAPVETESVAEAEEQRVDDVVEQEEDSADVGPRVRLGPNGEITLDEESLVIRRPAVQPSMRAIVYETGGETNYASFRKNPKGRSTWTAKQTAQFYKALSACGTDFTLMANFFPKRTRQELKNKFKREERRNRELIDRTITHHFADDPTQYYIDDLKLESDDPDEPERAQPAPKRGRGRKRKAPPTEDGGVREEVVEEEVVHEEIILPEEPETEQTTDETTGPATVGGSSAVTMGPCVSGGVAPVVGGPTPPLRLQAGQLVFYASRTQEQVVHVFVVAPPQAGASSELAARLSSPPLQRPAATASPSAAS